MTSSAEILIPQVEALQLIGESTVPLVQGDLRLSPLLQQPGTATATSDQPLLTLSIGAPGPGEQAAHTFPLFAHTVFGTHADQERWYSFQVAQPPAASAAADSSAPPSSSSFWVRLVLPSDVSLAGSPVQKQRDAFEDRLISVGLLRKGLPAASDEIAASLRESTGQANAALQQRADAHVGDVPYGRNAEYLDPSKATQSFAESAKEATDKAREWTSSASQTVGGWAESAGAFLGSKVADAQEALRENGYNLSLPGAGGAAGSRGSSRRSSGILGGGDDGQGGLPLPAGSAAAASNQKSAWQQTKEAASLVGSSIVTSASSLGSNLSEQASKVLGHESGSQAAVETAGNFGGAASNTGGIMADATVGTSTIAHGAYAVSGAVQNAQQPPSSASAGYYQHQS